MVMQSAVKKVYWRLTTASWYSSITSQVGKRSCWRGSGPKRASPLPTIHAIHDGYEIYVVEDCCGDVSQLAHDNAMKRVTQAGAKPVTSLSVMLELQRDPEGHLRRGHGHVKNHYGAYGIGVEYAYTIAHKAPATVFPEYVVRSAGSHR